MPKKVLYFIKFPVERRISELKGKKLSISGEPTYGRTYGHSENLGRASLFTKKIAFDTVVCIKKHPRDLGDAHVYFLGRKQF